ncbi:MAG: hypothetical protein Q7T49_01210 [bacterium]|nr:hypothetical protein [bacterium]
MAIKDIKKRINITTDADTESALEYAAQRDGLSMTTKASILLRLALELEEDRALVLLANTRASLKGKYLSHAKVWR